MKKLSLISVLLCFISIAFCQYNPTTSMQDEFKQISGLKTRQSGFEGFQTYSSNEVRGSQFFYPTWANGSVTTINNEFISNNYQFLFDKVRQELFIIYKPGNTPAKEVLQAEKGQIKSFTINTDKEHKFLPGKMFNAENPDDYYEVLEKSDSGFTLLKFVKTTFVKFDSRDIMKVKRGDMYDEFVDNISYYISYKSAKPQLIGFKEKTILNVIPISKKSIVDDYFEIHSQDEHNDDFLVKIVMAINK